MDNSKNLSNISIKLPLIALETHLGVTDTNEVLKIQPDDIIKSVKIAKDPTNRSISFEINKELFIKDVIENCVKPDLNLSSENVVVEYSSPNVAKPFHFGHLRSTIIGNFISNINQYLNNKVTRINYLGDWGTQFGFIKVGIEDLKFTQKQIQENPIKILYKCYVHANSLAEKDENVLNRAKTEFAKLEKGVESDINDWKTIIRYTENELTNTYERLGVKFDVYNCESMYGVKEIQGVIDSLKIKNLLVTQKDGKQTIPVNDKQITVIKSDGTTLYLTRDIAAAIDRHQKYNFDKMFYIVENGQHNHFVALFSILKSMGYKWADYLKHVKFGRIRGLSTRKGTAVFLNDILDESRELMMQKQIMSPSKSKIRMYDDL